MKIVKSLAVLVLLTVSIVYGINSVKTTPPAENKAKEFSLKDINGKTVKLSDYKGKIVIIDFWATWCGPCRRGIPDLISLQKEYADKLVVIGISVDREGQTKKDVPAFTKNNGINYPIVYADNKVISDYGGIEAIPTSFIIDKKGNIVKNFVGLVEKSEYVNIIKSIK